MKVFCLKFPGFQLLVIFFTFFTLCLQPPRGEAQANTLMVVGKWKLNIAKSKFTGPPPKSMTLTWEWVGDALKHTEEGVNSKEEPNAAHFIAKFDGKNYPVFSGDNDKVPARYVRLKRIDAYTMESINSKDGKDMMTYRHSVSRDGKTDTITQKGANVVEEGRQVNDIYVYERQ